MDNQNIELENEYLDRRLDHKAYHAFLFDIFGSSAVMDIMPTNRDIAYLRRHGEWFDNVGLHGYQRGTPKQCYVNARHAAERNADLTYVQGFMADESGIVYGHAWCVDREGRTIELTLGCESPHGDRRYFGVRFTRSHLYALGCAYGTYDWYEGFSKVFAQERALAEADNASDPRS